MKIGPEAEEDEDNLQKFLEFAQWQASLLTKPMEEDIGTPARRTEHRTSPKKPLRPKWKSGGRITSSAVALAVTATGSCPFCESHLSGVKLPRASTVSSGWVQANSSQALALKHIERVGSVDGTQHRAMRHAGLGKSQNGSPPDCACVRTGSAFSTPARKCHLYGRTSPKPLVSRGRTRRGGVAPERRLRKVEFRLGADSDSKQPASRRSVEALVIPWICGRIPKARVARRTARLKTPFKRPLIVDILIRVDHYYDFVTGPMRRNATGPVALETLLSWVVCGKPRPGPVAEKRVLLTKIEEPTNASLRRFWEVEAMGINPEDDAEPEDARMVEKFEDSLSFDGERYQVRLPWSRSQPDLPVRIKQAMRQLTAVERRLARSDKDSRDNNQPYGSIWTTAWLNQHLNPVL
ncbi:conserved hypothetical protein [Trichinella spiralis]|uniref:hypothetical protein n=1 Tax=Trichinella spiralis TaxID=6334 RepID=UPI0001EFE1E5|nr:conserved hypothetical protein [Trichinella spiralis]